MQKADLFKQAQARRDAEQKASSVKDSAKLPVCSIQVDGVDWFVCKTEWMREKVAAAALVEAGFRSYVPMVKTRIYRQRPFRGVDVERPLFATYGFVGMEPDDRRFYDARRAKGVVALLGVMGYPMRIPGKTIHDIDLALQRGDFSAPIPINLFAPDDHVRLNDGPFMLFTGIVEKALPGDTFRVLMSLFRKQFSLRVQACQLERIAV